MNTGDDSQSLSSDSGSVTHFFSRLRGGDRTAAEKIWVAFCPRLLGLARSTLGNRRWKSEDAEDAVQSAFISFWRRAELGEFAGELGRNNLWNLLGVITVRKTLKHLERDNAQKRGGGQVRSAGSLVDQNGQPIQLDDLLGKMPALDFDIHCEELLNQLDGEQRTIALLRLMNYTNSEVASICKCSERKVERKLQLIRLIWEDQYPE